MPSTTAVLTPEEASSESCMIPSGASPREARRLTLLLTMKGRTRIGTWNACTLCEAGKAAQVASEMRQYNSVLAIYESKWNGLVRLHLQPESGYSTLGMRNNSMHMYRAQSDQQLSWQGLTQRAERSPSLTGIPQPTTAHDQKEEFYKVF